MKETPEIDIVLGDGEEEFSKNFKVSYVRNLKTLKEKLDFENKFFATILSHYPLYDKSEYDLENCKKVLEKFTIENEPVVTITPTVVQSEETPDNLSELLAFAEYIQNETSIEGSGIELLPPPIEGIERLVLQEESSNLLRQDDIDHGEL